MGNEMDIKFGKKSRTKGNQESFIMYLFKKKGLKYLSIKKQSIDRANV